MKRWTSDGYLDAICRHYEFVEYKNHFGRAYWEREQKGKCQSLKLLSGRIVICATSFALALIDCPALEPSWATEAEWAADLRSFVEVVERKISRLRKVS